MAINPKPSGKRPIVPPEFVDLVRQMRTAQRVYFKSRTRIDLQASVDLERRVDQYLAQYEVLEMRWDQFASGHKTDEVQMRYTVRDDSASEEEKES